LESISKEIQGDELDLEMAFTDEEKSTLQDAKASKTWTALRLASMTSIKVLDKYQDGGNIENFFQPDAIEEASLEEAATASTHSPEVQGHHSVAEEDVHVMQEVQEGLEEERPGSSSQVTAAEGTG
jgi:THO complex subunit 1